MMIEEEKSYSEMLILRFTSPETELLRGIKPLEPNLLTGKDSALTTWSNIKATACLKVAAAVLKVGTTDE